MGQFPTTRGGLTNDGNNDTSLQDWRSPAACWEGLQSCDPLAVRDRI